MQPATEIPVEDLPLMIAGLGLSFEAVCGGALHNMDPRLIERIYRATWWVPSARDVPPGRPQAADRQLSFYDPPGQPRVDGHGHPVG